MNPEFDIFRQRPRWRVLFGRCFKISTGRSRAERSSSPSECSQRFTFKTTPHRLCSLEIVTFTDSLPLRQNQHTPHRIPRNKKQKTPAIGNKHRVRGYKQHIIGNTKTQKTEKNEKQRIRKPNRLWLSASEQKQKKKSDSIFLSLSLSLSLSVPHRHALRWWTRSLRRRSECCPAVILRAALFAVDRVAVVTVVTVVVVVEVECS